MLLITITNLLTSILKLKNTNNDKLAIYGIDINPMNLHEFIINGDDEYIKMYDRRHLSKSIKELRRPIPIVSINNIF